MSNLQAALGVAQLEKLDQSVARKRAMGKKYTELFSDMQKHLQLPLEKTEYAQNIYWVYGLVLKETVHFGAEDAMKKLQALGVGTRPFFYPMHRQPIFQRMGLFKGEHYPVAERLSDRGFYIPSGVGLTQEQIIKVAQRVKSVMEVLEPGDD